MATATEGRRVIARARSDPQWFWGTVLGAKGYDKQYQMVEAVRDHNRVATVGCNGSGKDFTAGRVILWWQSTHYPAKTVVIGPTHRQVHDVVFSEARTAFHASRGHLDGEMFRSSRWEVNDEHFATGFATTDPLNIQGYHSPNLLVIVTEAHNVPQGHFEAIDRLNPSRILMTGNPLSSAGDFYEAFHTQTHRWKTIQISAFDTPNVQEKRVILPGVVTWEDVEGKKEHYGEDSPLYIAGVLGQFPDNLEDSVVPRSLLLEAAQRDLSDGDSKATLACDVARFGEDSTVVYRRRGHSSSLLWKTHGRDTQFIAGKLKTLAEEDESVDTIVVDDNGVGGGVTDRLREERPRSGAVRIVAFNGGASAKKDDKYANAVTEAWYAIREAAIEGMLDIDDNPALIGQLASRKFKYLGSGRVQLESKEDYKKRAGLSPDDADALAMAYSPLTRRNNPGVRFLEV